MKLPKWAAVVLIASLLLNAKTALDLMAMKNQIQNLQNNVNSISHSVQNTVSSSMYRIDEMLKKEASLVNEFKYEYMEHKDKRVDYLLSIKPKVYNQDEKLFFLLKAGKGSSQLIPAETADGVTFTAKVNVSIFDTADLDLVIDDGKSKKTEKLESIYPIAEKFAAQIEARPLGGSMRFGSEGIVMSHGFELVQHFKSEGNAPVLKEAVLNIELNGNLIDTIPMEWKDSPEYGRYHIMFSNYKIPCKVGDSIVIYATAKDDGGFNYKCHMDGWTVEEGGRIGRAPDNFEYGKVEIY